jgi:hypothetical protein
MNDTVTDSVDSITERISFKDESQLKSRRRRLRFPRYEGSKSSRKSGLNPIWSNKERHDSEAPTCEAPSRRALHGEGVIRLDTEGGSHPFKGFPLHNEMQPVAYDQMKAIPGVPFADIDCEDMSFISNITTAAAAADSFDSHMDRFLCVESYHHGKYYDIQLNPIAENISCAGMSLEAATDGLCTDFLHAVNGGMQSRVQQSNLTSKPNSATGSCASILDSSSDRAEDEAFEVQYSPTSNSEVACVTPVQEQSLKRRVNEPLQLPLPTEDCVEVHLSQSEPCPIKQLITKLSINETALQNKRKAWWRKSVMKTSRVYYAQSIQNRPAAKASDEVNGRIFFFSPLRSISKSLLRGKLEEKIEMEHQVQKKRHKIAESQNIPLGTIATDLSISSTLSPYIRSRRSSAPTTTIIVISAP